MEMIVKTMEERKPPNHAIREKWVNKILFWMNRN
jgi:hypothetical protein